MSTAPSTPRRGGGYAPTPPSPSSGFGGGASSGRLGVSSPSSPLSSSVGGGGGFNKKGAFNFTNYLFPDKIPPPAVMVGGAASSYGGPVSPAKASASAMRKDSPRHGRRKADDGPVPPSAQPTSSSTATASIAAAVSNSKAPSALHSPIVSFRNTSSSPRGGSVGGANPPASTSLSVASVPPPPAGSTSDAPPLLTPFAIPSPPPQHSSTTAAPQHQHQQHHNNTINDKMAIIYPNALGVVGTVGVGSGSGGGGRGDAHLDGTMTVIDSNAQSLRSGDDFFLSSGEEYSFSGSSVFTSPYTNKRRDGAHQKQRSAHSHSGGGANGAPSSTNNANTKAIPSFQQQTVSSSKHAVAYATVNLEGAGDDGLDGSSSSNGRGSLDGGAPKTARQKWARVFAAKGETLLDQVRAAHPSFTPYMVDTRVYQIEQDLAADEAAAKQAYCDERQRRFELKVARLQSQLEVPSVQNSDGTSQSLWRSRVWLMNNAPEALGKAREMLSHAMALQQHERIGFADSALEAKEATLSQGIADKDAKLAAIAKRCGGAEGVLPFKVRDAKDVRREALLHGQLSAKAHANKAAEEEKRRQRNARRLSIVEADSARAAAVEEERFANQWSSHAAKRAAMLEAVDRRDGLADAADDARAKAVADRIYRRMVQRERGVHQRHVEREHARGKAVEAMLAASSTNTGHQRTQGGVYYRPNPSAAQPPPPLGGFSLPVNPTNLMMGTTASSSPPNSPGRHRQQGRNFSSSNAGGGASMGRSGAYGGGSISYYTNNTNGASLYNAAAYDNNECSSISPNGRSVGFDQTREDHLLSSGDGAEGGASSGSGGGVSPHMYPQRLRALALLNANESIARGRLATVAVGLLRDLARECATIYAAMVGRATAGAEWRKANAARAYRFDQSRRKREDENITQAAATLAASKAKQQDAARRAEEAAEERAATVRQDTLRRQIKAEGLRAEEASKGHHCSGCGDGGGLCSSGLYCGGGADGVATPRRRLKYDGTPRELITMHPMDLTAITVVPAPPSPRQGAANNNHRGGGGAAAKQSQSAFLLSASPNRGDDVCSNAPSNYSHYHSDRSDAMSLNGRGKGRDGGDDDARDDNHNHHKSHLPPTVLLDGAIMKGMSSNIAQMLVKVTGFESFDQHQQAVLRAKEGRLGAVVERNRELIPRRTDAYERRMTTRQAEWDRLNAKVKAKADAPSPHVNYSAMHAISSQLVREVSTINTTSHGHDGKSAGGGGGGGGAQTARAPAPPRPPQAASNNAAASPLSPLSARFVGGSGASHLSPPAPPSAPRPVAVDEGGGMYTFPLEDADGNPLGPPAGWWAPKFNSSALPQPISYVAGRANNIIPSINHNRNVVAPPPVAPPPPPASAQTAPPPPRGRSVGTEASYGGSSVAPSSITPSAQRGASGYRGFNTNGARHHGNASTHHASNSDANTSSASNHSPARTSLSDQKLQTAHEGRSGELSRVVNRTQTHNEHVESRHQQWRANLLDGADTNTFAASKGKVDAASSRREELLTERSQVLGAKATMRGDMSGGLSPKELRIMEGIARRQEREEEKRKRYRVTGGGGGDV